MDGTTERKSGIEDKRGQLEKRSSGSSSMEITPWEKYAVSVEGNVYFVCDDTPPANFFLFLKPLLARYGFFLTSWSVPEKWAKILVMAVKVLAWLVYPVVQFNPSVSFSMVHEKCHTYTFNDRLARLHLNYTPIFTRKDGLRRTTQFYDAKFKEAMTRHLVDNALSSKHLGMLRRMSKIKRDIAAIDMADTGKRFRVKPRPSKSGGWLPL